jgi:hypothetical protein
MPLFDPQPTLRFLPSRHMLLNQTTRARSNAVSVNLAEEGLRCRFILSKSPRDFTVARRVVNFDQMREYSLWRLL